MSSFLSAAAKRYKMAGELSRLRGGPRLWYFADAMRCAYEHGASAENYFVLRFYSLGRSERKKYLTSGRSKEIDAALNAGATEADRRALAYKDEFDLRFATLNSRAFLPAGRAVVRDVTEFIERFPEFIVKPVHGTQGHGIRRLRAGKLKDREGFALKCIERGLLLEEPIRQHRAMAEMNPTSVNTIRLNAARTAQGVRLIGAALRCGGAGAVVDNFHSGAVAYPLDLQGVICGPGRDNTSLADYMFHPPTGVRMPGRRIPHWEQVLSAVEQGMALVPSMGYVGWDVAVTETGVELIEGNYNWPGGNIIQIDGVGKYPAALSCIG